MKPEKPFLDASPFKMNGVYCKLIGLIPDLFAIVDAHNYERIAAHQWYAQWDPHANSFRAIRYVRNLAGKKWKVVSMHREVLRVQAGDPCKVDHVRPGETLLNTEENLRRATASENNCNIGMRSTNACGFKWVHLHRSTGKYRAQVKFNGKRRDGGLFATPELAHEAARKIAIEMHGKFVNFG